ncbi:type III effector (plasmid) [Ralstonia solanacearum]|nr:type III effector [Ralstonia solanacearum]
MRATSFKGEQPHSIQSVPTKEGTSTPTQTLDSSSKPPQPRSASQELGALPKWSLREQGDDIEHESSRLFSGPLSANVSARIDSPRVIGQSQRSLGGSTHYLSAIESPTLSPTRDELSVSHTIDIPPLVPLVPLAPAGRTTGGATLTESEQFNAKLASVMQQFVVSGASWGITRKLFQEFAPALGQLIGSKGHTVAGGIYGQMVGSVLGNMLGGATLGAAHYVAEHGAKKLRTVIGHGSEYAPAVSSEAMKQAIFIGTFATFMACKGIAKTATPSQGSVMKDTGMAYALDIAFSAFGGAAAESITQLLANGFTKIKPDWSWDELKSRVAGGLAAGTVSALGDVNANITEPNADVKGGKWAVAGLGGAINSVMALSSWFLVRKVATDHLKERASQARQATAAAPSGPAIPPQIEMRQFHTHLNRTELLTTMRDMVEVVQASEQLRATAAT